MKTPERKVTVNGFCLEFLYQRPQGFGQMDDPAVSGDHPGLVFNCHCGVVVVSLFKIVKIACHNRNTENV